jgi:hypothetical protein
MRKYWQVYKLEVNMKNTKWLWVTLTIILTFIVLAGVAAAGFRAGMMQGASLMRKHAGPTSQFPSFESMHKFEGNFNGPAWGDPQRMQEFGHHRPGPGGFEHGRGGFWFRPLFGLVQLVVFGLLVWGGVVLYRRSGWRFVRVNASEAEPVEVMPAPKKKKKK